MKLHCIDELKNGQQLFMPSGLIASVTVNPEKKEIWLQYQDELNTISDVVSFKDFEKLIQDGVEVLRDDIPLPLRVLEHKGANYMNEAFGIADNIELEIPDELVNSIAQSGDNEEAVNAALEDVNIKEQLARYTDKELLSAIDSYAIDLTDEERKDRKVLEQYVVWLIAWNIADDDYEQNDELAESLLNEDELDDEINQDLSNSFSQEELIDAAESNLNGYVRDIFDYGDSSLDSEVYDDLAYKYDFIHRKEYGDDYILLDVKGRPNLSFDADDLGIDDETFYYELNYQITDFADELREEFPGFVVLGRSGGYWGLEVSHGDLKFTKNLAEKFVEEIMNDSEYLEDALANPEIKTADDLVEDFWDSNTIDFGYDSVLDILDEMSFTDAVDFTDEFKKSLEDLKTSIDSAEKEMNNIDFWKERFENDGVANELLSDETGEDEDV